MDRDNSGNKEGITIDIEEIMTILQHRYPFLMIDKLTKGILGEKAVGIKSVTINEPFFQGHFPHKPIMPGVMIIESMAQTAAVLVIKTLKRQNKEILVYFTSIDNARFRKPVVPGDVLYIYATKLQKRSAVWKFECKAKVENQIVAEAVLTAKMMDN